MLQVYCRTVITPDMIKIYLNWFIFFILHAFSSYSMLFASKQSPCNLVQSISQVSHCGGGQEWLLFVRKIKWQAIICYKLNAILHFQSGEDAECAATWCGNSNISEPIASMLRVQKCYMLTFHLCLFQPDWNNKSTFNVALRHCFALKMTIFMIRDSKNVALTLFNILPQVF